jgi:pilus assembly protein Flp/PilA
MARALRYAAPHRDTGGPTVTSGSGTAPHLKLAAINSGHPGKEKAMLNLFKKLAKDESGQDLAEYGIALAVVAVAAATAAIAIKGNVTTLWQNGSTAIQSAVSGN